MKKPCLFCKKHNKMHVICDLEERYMFTGQKLIRPKVNWLTAFAYIVISLLLGFVVAKATAYAVIEQTEISLGLAKCIFVSTFIFVVALICVLKSKTIMIFIIHIYQRYAPYQTRATCLFIPNCSDYMILAIQKYGTIKGVRMGLERFKRCEHPNGGEDYP